MSVRRTALSLVAMGVTLLLLGCLPGPPLRVYVEHEHADVDVRTLGEYGTAVSRIRLTSQGPQDVIWEVISPDAPQIPGFPLDVGKNLTLPGRLKDFGFRVVSPESGGVFRLDTGVQYTIQVWGAGGRRPSSESFAFPGKGGSPTPGPDSHIGARSGDSGDLAVTSP